MNISEFLNLITLVALAGITWWYAKQTRDIAKATQEQAEATKQQAEAGARMAKEMEETRELAYRPELALWSVPHQVRGGQYVSVNIENVGSGPTRDIEIECWWQDSYYKHDVPAGLGPRETRLFSCMLSSGPEQPKCPGNPVNFVIRINWNDLQGKPVGSLVKEVTLEQMQKHGTQGVPRSGRIATVL